MSDNSRRERKIFSAKTGEENASWFPACSKVWLLVDKGNLIREDALNPEIPSRVQCVTEERRLPMAHLVLSIDIGATEVKAVLADVSWRETRVLGMYVEPVPKEEDVAHRLPPREPDFPSREDGEVGDAEEAGELGEGAPEPALAETPPPWVFAVADLLKKHKINYNEIYLALPGNNAIAHLINLPFENRRRIEQVLPFELENIVPFDMDRMHMAFDVLGKTADKGARVLVCVTPKDKMQRYLGYLGQAGVDPQIIDWAPYTLYAAAKLSLAEELGVFAIVDIGHTHTDLAVMNEGQLVDVRSIPLGGKDLTDALAADLKIDWQKAEALKKEKADLATDDLVGKSLQSGLEPLLVRLRQTLHGVRSKEGIEITRLYLSGRASLLPGLAAYLGEELALEVLPLQPLAADIPVSVDVNDAVQQARFATSLSLLHRGKGALRRVRLNLRFGEFFYRRQQKAMKASLRTIGVTAALILALLVYNVVASHMQKKRHYQTISDQVIQVYLKTFPGAQPSQPLEQFQGQVSKTMAKYKTVGFFGEGDLRAADILKMLSEAISPEITVDFRKFDISLETLKIEGECNSFPDVDRLEEALKKLPGFKNVKKESSKSVSEKVKFKFVIHFVDKLARGQAGRPGRPTMTPRQTL